MKYRIVWDNGNHASGEFDIDFDSEEEAEDYGNDWLKTMEAIDPDDEGEYEDGYSFEVVEVPA